MATLPTFNNFSFNDSGFITERIEHKSFADRSAIRSKIARREGVKLQSTEFGEKEITIVGAIIKSSASELQASIDSMKKFIQEEEGALVIETGRTYRATVTNLVIPDEHYNQSKANFELTLVSSDPFAEGSQLTVTQVVPSGLTTFSGFVMISGTFFVRPTITYNAPAGDGVGLTRISKIALTHMPTGQQVTVSGFGSGTSLVYNNTVSFNFDNFSTLEGSTAKDNSGSFARWSAGDNNYLLTFSGVSVGGTLQLSYNPRYI